MVGSYVVQALLAQGHTVHALVRSKENLGLLRVDSASLHVQEGDILDIALLGTYISLCEVVVHCAAVVSYAPNRYDEMFQINVEGTQNIVNECLTQQKELIHISSIAAIGHTEHEPTDESGKWNESDVSTYYSKTKYLSEVEVWRGIEEGLRAVILNPSVVLGRGDLSRSSSKLFSYVLKESKYYSEGCMNYVDVRDVAAIVSASLQRKHLFGKRYILNAGQVSYKVFFQKIATLYGVKAPDTEVSNIAAAMAWRWEYLRYLFTGKEPLITKETARLSKSKKVYDNSAATTAFEYSFRPLDQTLQWCCEKNTSISRP